MSLFAGLKTQAQEALVEVPNFFVATGGALKTLAAKAPLVPCPQDQGIAPTTGDDTSAPNAVTAARLNRVVCVSSANIGYSKAAKDTQVLPSALEYHAAIDEGAKLGEYALTLRMVLEYQSAFPEEGMVVWIKKHQQAINDEKIADLMLVETAFEDFVDGKWVPISTDVRYTEEAEAVVQAVITSDSGQTAGRVTTEGSVEDAKLGPVGERGRIVLTYRCEQLYSYAEMGLGDKPGSRQLVPLSLQLPWAALDNPGNSCAVRAVVRGPPGASRLSPEANILAHRDLQQSLIAAGSMHAQTQAVVLPEEEFSLLENGPEWSFSSESLPPRPTSVLVWMSIPNGDEEWEQVEVEPQAQTSRATLLRASPAEESLLRAALPGCQQGQLLRCKVDTEGPKRRPGSVRVHTDITISDASGSTGMRRGDRTVRALLNQHEERRMLKRLEAIPKLRQAGILMDNDVWRQHFVIFNSGVSKEFGVESAVKDLDDTTVSSLIAALTSSGPSQTTATSALQAAGKTGLLSSWHEMLETLRGVGPGGTTNFSAGAERARQRYEETVRGKYVGRADVECTSYVNFDTDGGHNHGSWASQIRALVEKADVVQGHVLGVGAWVSQNCATKVASILKGSASLSLEFPADAQADTLFRQDLSRWIKVLRATPVALTISAGATAWQARHGARNENGCDCLVATGENLRFDPPDVSELDHTKAVVRGLQAGESATLYLLSRWQPEELAGRLRVDVGGVLAQVSTGRETMQGVPLGNHWLSLLSDKPTDSKVVANKSVLCGALRQRVADDLSFAWNLPTKSGSTAAIGRAKTQHHLPVPLGQQPEEPKAPSLQASAMDVPRLACSVQNTWGGGGYWGGGGSWSDSRDGGAPVARAQRCAAPGGMVGIPRVVRGGGAATSFVAGGLRMMKSAAAPAAPAAPAALGFAAYAAPAVSAAPAAASLQSLQAALASPESFSGAGSAEAARRSKKKRPMRRVASPRSDDDDDDDALGETSSSLRGPQELLDGTRYMQWSHPENARDSAQRSVQALKQLATSAVQPTVPGVGAGNEDPLVGDLMGDVTAGTQRTRAGQSASGVVHGGFTCDATNTFPIVGVRFKATSALDLDINEASRRAGKFSGGSGFCAIPDATCAMRWGLGAVLQWWPLLWPTRGDLFSVTPSDLASLQVDAMAKVISNLPDQAVFTFAAADNRW